MHIIPSRKRLLIWLCCLIVFSIAIKAYDYGLLRIFVLPYRKPCSIVFKSWIPQKGEDAFPQNCVYTNTIDCAEDIARIVSVFQFSISHLNLRLATYQQLSFNYDDGKIITIYLLSDGTVAFRHDGIMYHANGGAYGEAMKAAGIPSKYILWYGVP